MGDRVLLEREAELESLDALIESASAGAGRVALICGEAGIGKSSLLVAVARRAAASGVAVLSARAGAMERDFAFGVVRRLFEPLLAGDAVRHAALPARSALGLTDTGTEASPFEVREALVRLARRLADSGPLVLIVDDAHWADPASLHWLLHLARRIEDRAIALLVAERAGEPGDHRDVLRSLATEAGARVIDLQPLSPAAVAAVVRDHLPMAGDQLCDACAVATRGNPFLLVELAAELTAQGIPPVASAEALTAMAPGNVNRAVLLRLARLGGDAVALAQAAAILDGEGTLAVAAGVAGLPVNRAADAADDLARVRILEPGSRLRFVHPLLRAAVYGDIGVARRSAEHRRAAELLGGSRAALHAEATEPSSDPWVVELLHGIGREAATRGAPAEASRLLARALAEPPPRERRAALLVDLGGAELDAGRTADAADHLREALAFATGARERLTAARGLAGALASLGRMDEGAAMLNATLSSVPAGEEERNSLAAMVLVYASLGSATSRYAESLRADAERATGVTRGERLLLAGMSFHDATWVVGSAERAADMARCALAGGALLDDSGPGRPEVVLALTALMMADAFDEAADWLERLQARAAQDGSIRTHATALMFGARLKHAAGRLADAETDAREAMRLARESGALIDPPAVLTALVGCLVERGEVIQAESELQAAGLDQPVPTSSSGWALLVRRATVRRALGRLAEAEADARRAIALRGGGGLLARGTLAEILWAAGKKDEARSFAAADAETAGRWGAPSLVGMTARVLGLVTGGKEGRQLLEDAVEVLAPAPRRLEHARALVDLGSALRRGNRRVEGRERLEAGLELAHRCGAKALEARAREELIATGARPRRPVRTGVAALTASEARVARLVADGLTNREIAQTLFVTRRTVETHLTSAYRKLDVDSRQEMAALLAKDRGGIHDADRPAVVQPGRP